MRVPRLLSASLLPLLLTTTAPSLWAEDGSMPPALANAARESDLAYDLVADLVTTIGTRFAGTPEEAAARVWAVDRLEALGFENVHIEEFQVPGWRRGVEEATLLTPGEQPLVLTTLGGSPATPEGGLEAPLVFVERFEDVLAAPVGAYDGAIVFINDELIGGPDVPNYDAAVAKRKFGAVEVARRGGVGVLVRSLSTSVHRFAHTGGQWFSSDVDSIPAAAVSVPDANRIARLARAGAALSVRMRIEPEDIGPQMSGNVVAEIPGTTRADEVVLLGAHIDTWDNTDGALDDGAGIGIVVSAAHLIAQQDTPPQRTIRVVLFGAEEIGALGGFAYAHRHGVAFEDLARRIESGSHNRRPWAPPIDDMATWPGFDGDSVLPLPRAPIVLAMEADAGGGSPRSLDSNAEGETLALIDRAGARLATMGVPRGHNHTTGGADVYGLHAGGVPVARINQDMTRYFDVHHTPDDTLEQVDPETLAETVAAYAVFVDAVANPISQ